MTSNVFLLFHQHGMIVEYLGGFRAKCNPQSTNHLKFDGVKGKYAWQRPCKRPLRRGCALKPSSKHYLCK